MQQVQENSRRIVEHRPAHLVEGMEIARDIFAADGTVLVSGGTILNRTTIEKLGKWQVAKVPVFSQVNANPLSDPKLKQFLHTYQHSVHAVERAFHLIRETGDVPVDALAKTADAITGDVCEVGNAVDQLYHLPPCDDYTLRHSVNVSVVAALIAMWLKLPADIVSAVALTGLMHDIGKAKLPPAILNQTRKLSASDYAEYMRHPVLGLELLADRTDIAWSVKTGILQHHEREDGSGYPRGLMARDIHPYAKIVAVADRYDEELTINLEPDKVVSPYTSLEILWDAVNSLDAKTCITFYDNMTNFLSGNIVRLSDGRQGRVVYVNKDWPSRSMVQLDCGDVLDLMEQPDVCIQYLIR
ncbi:MAG: HD domain-containing protein [Negativicutes bacterium]|nr:HD domain-containing protein [Negativicutes bacterium]